MKFLVVVFSVICLLTFGILLLSNGCRHTEIREQTAKPKIREREPIAGEEDIFEVEEGEGLLEEILQEEEKKYSKLSVQELFEEIVKPTNEEVKVLNAELIKELRRRRLTSEEIDWFLKRLKNARNLLELDFILLVLRENAKRMSEKQVFYFWNLIKQHFYSLSDVIKRYSSFNYVNSAVGILLRCKLSEEYYESVIDDLMKMAEIDEGCYMAAAAFGKLAVKALMEATKKGKHRALVALSLIKDPDAKEDFWKLVKEYPDYAEYTMKAYLNSGGKPPAALILRWLKEEPVDSGYSDAAVKAAKRALRDNEDIGKALIELFEKGTGDPNIKYDFRVAEALWCSETEVVRQYIERTLKNKDKEEEEKRGQLLGSLWSLLDRYEVKAEQVKWVVPIVESIKDDEEEHHLLRMKAKGILFWINR